MHIWKLGLKQICHADQWGKDTFFQNSNMIAGYTIRFIFLTGNF